MEKAKNVLTWCVLAVFAGYAASAFGWVEFPKWVGFPAGLTVAVFMVLNFIDNEKAQARRLATGDEAVQKLSVAEQEIVTLKRERDWVVSCAVMYGSGRLLNMPSQAVIPTLNRLGKRLPSGNNRLQQQVVIVQVVRGQNLAYVAAARPGATYPVLEDQLAYEISAIDFVPYASEELIDDWFQAGLLGELKPQYVELARHASEQYGSALKTASALRDSIDAAAIEARCAAAPVT